MDVLRDGTLRLVMQHSPVGMLVVSPAGEMVAANDAACGMFGYERHHLLTMRWADITHSDDLVAGAEMVGSLLAGERTSFRQLKRYVRGDGAIVWGDLSVALLRDDDGSPLHLVAQVVDVTEQRIAAKRLAEANATIYKQARTVAAIYDAVDVGLVLIDRSGRYEQINRRHHDFVALAHPEGRRGQAGQVGEVFQADGHTRMVREDLPSYRASRGEEFDDVRLWVGSDPATRRALSVSARSTRHADGTLIGAALAYKDVTDFMRALAVKDDFVASVSHELRTPLTSVLGYLEVLSHREDLPADVKRHIGAVERNTERLGALVSDLLYVAQGAEGAVRLAPSAADLAEVVAATVQEAQPVAAAAGVSLVVDVPDTLVSVADPRRVRQIADNLVSNAVKYTDPGGEVTVRVLRVGDHCELSVADSGIGIAPEDIDRLFARFFRASEDRVRDTPGTGLGLSIVHSIVEASGGEIRVESKVGVGSTFTVALPLVAPRDE